MLGLENSKKMRNNSEIFRLCLTLDIPWSTSYATKPRRLNQSKLQKKIMNKMIYQNYRTIGPNCLIKRIREVLRNRTNNNWNYETAFPAVILFIIWAQKCNILIGWQKKNITTHSCDFFIPLYWFCNGI